jgi:trk system potassium uptake protein TrkH
MPRSILLWRALLQGFGGIGIIVMAMTIFPVLRIGGMQLFRIEFADRSEKILPRVSQIATAIVSTYVFLIILCAFCLFLAGMSVFDAVCHALATVSTGGHSTHDKSIAFYESQLIEAIIVAFMIIGGSTLILFIKLWRGNYKALWTDSQIRAYFGVITVSCAIVTLWLWNFNEYGLLFSFRQALFSVVAILTSTGFVISDYSQWGNFVPVLLFFLSLIGGCTGSTTGGIKIFRFQVLFSVAMTQLRHLRRPHGVFVPTFNHQKISEGVATSVFTFITLYCFCLVILALGLGLFNLDFITALSGASAAIGNLGSGLGNVIGPGGVYTTFDNGPKCILMFGMILGRLELLTVLILLMPSFWKD